MNGYFQLDIKTEGTFLVIHPPIDDGIPVSYDEVSRYLHDRSISGFDAKKLKSLMEAEEALEQIRFRVCDSLGHEESGSMEIDPAGDYMSCTVRFYAPSVNGSPLSKNDIITTLNKKRVHFGIDEEKIDDFLREPAYCTDYILAHGKPVEQGVDASIEYFFETAKNLQPALNEDGTVDYHNLNMIAHVSEGDLLARLTPEVEGKAGINIYNEKVKPAKIKKLKLKHGKNIRVSEDGLELYSMVDGHAALTKDTVFVSDVYQVPANVDNSTGDIDYTGSVVIKGNVNTGFSVKAGGDIVVNGIVEGATLRAGGKIVVKQGVHGMSKAKIFAESSITVKFIENAEVYSRESVNSDTIMHSEVSAKYEVRVMGEKGFISGGKIRAGAKITTMTLGSDMGATTKIEVGISTEKKRELKELEHTREELEKNRDKLEPTIMGVGEKVAKGLKLPEDKMAFLKNVAVAYQDVKRKLAESEIQYEELMEEFEIAENACVDVMGYTFPGCIMNISGAKKSITEKRARCRYVKDGVDIMTEVL